MPERTGQEQDGLSQGSITGYQEAQNGHENGFFFSLLRPQALRYVKKRRESDRMKSFLDDNIYFGHR